MSFWPTKDHWSVELPVRTNHYLCPSMEKDGFVLLTPYAGEIDKKEWESLTYFDWKSGGDTNFAPLASADGELECRGFWDKGKTDKEVAVALGLTTKTARNYLDHIFTKLGLHTRTEAALLYARFSEKSRWPD